MPDSADRIPVYGEETEGSGELYAPRLRRLIWILGTAAAWLLLLGIAVLVRALYRRI